MKKFRAWEQGVGEYSTSFFKRRQRVRHLKFAHTKPFFDKSFTPTKIAIPEWFKAIPLHGKPFDKNKVPYPKTLKACVPFLDALTIGYTLNLYSDLGVESTPEGDVNFTWNDKDVDTVRVRTKDGTETLPAPVGYYDHRFAWNTQTAFEVPKGYCFLFTHPLNRMDLPFYTLSGVVDGPFISSGGDLPFFLKEGFNGVIPQGTPIAQVIPFKRENWTSEWVPELWDKAKHHWWWSNSTAIGWYKKNIWKKKTYN
jgi:hypothetical protein